MQIAGRALPRRDLEAPGQIGGATEQLLVEVVAPASDRLGGEQPGGDAVEERKRLDVLDTGHDHDGDRPAGQHAPDAEAALPDLERTEPVVGEQLVVAHHVVHAGAHNAAHDDPHGHVVEGLGVEAARHPAPLGDPRRHQDADREQQSVGVERDRPEVDDAVVGARDRREERHGRSS